jgi:hypothetical protein
MLPAVMWPWHSLFASNSRPASSAKRAARNVPVSSRLATVYFWLVSRLFP